MATPAVQAISRRWASRSGGFWARAAAQLPWFRTWDRAFEWTFPTFRWFIGAQTNLAYNALDHHVADGRGGAHGADLLQRARRAASFTYAELLARVTRAAAALRGLGIRKGDRAHDLHADRRPEAIVLMLATVRIGAIHSVVFAGFGARALGDRIQASGSRLVFTADVTYRKGKDIRSEDDRRRRARTSCRTPSSTSSCCNAARSAGRARSRTARHHLGRVPRARRRTVGRARSDGGERAGLHPRDVRHDRAGRSWRFTRTAAIRSTSPAWGAGASG